MPPFHYSTHCIRRALFRYPRQSIETWTQSAKELHRCDVAALLFDVRRPESFAYIRDVVLPRLPKGTPCVYVACRSEAHGEASGEASGEETGDGAGDGAGDGGGGDEGGGGGEGGEGSGGGNGLTALRGDGAEKWGASGTGATRGAVQVDNQRALCLHLALNHCTLPHLCLCGAIMYEGLSGREHADG
jgi:hypothetical protein